MLNWGEWLAKEPFISVMGLMALMGFLSADLRRSRSLELPFRRWLLSLLRALAAAALTGFLSYLLFRKKPTRLLRALLYGMIAFFVIVYPLAGLLTETVHRNTFDNFVQVILIVYLFGLSLYSRSKTTPMEAP